MQGYADSSKIKRTAAVSFIVCIVMLFVNMVIVMLKNNYDFIVQEGEQALSSYQSGFGRQYNEYIDSFLTYSGMLTLIMLISFTVHFICYRKITAVPPMALSLILLISYLIPYCVLSIGYWIVISCLLIGTLILFCAWSYIQ